MARYPELINLIENIEDQILAGLDNTPTEDHFDDRLNCTKIWYSKISYTNKKLLVLALIDDLKSSWTLSNILKTFWIYKTKDAVMSVNLDVPWSSFDQIPLDHNRTVLPKKTLAENTLTLRKWFLQLNPDQQGTVIRNLLSISGSPIILDVLDKCERKYRQQRDAQLKRLKNATIVPFVPPPVDKYTNAQQWNALMNSIRVSNNEIDLQLDDGTIKKVWRINRVPPENMETVDYIQLLPSTIAKRIFSYLPVQNLSEYAKVNKYWAYVIDELKAEISMRNKIDLEIEKVREKYGNLQSISKSSGSNLTSMTKSKYSSAVIEEKKDQRRRKKISDNLNMSEALDRRGAAHGNLFKWCENVLKQTSKQPKNLDPMFATCPLSSRLIDIPLTTPLQKDPSVAVKSKVVQSDNIPSLERFEMEKEKERYTLWTSNMTGLYPVFKVNNYEFPLL